MISFNLHPSLMNIIKSMSYYDRMSIITYLKPVSLYKFEDLKHYSEYTQTKPGLHRSNGIYKISDLISNLGYWQKIRTKLVNR